MEIINRTLTDVDVDIYDYFQKSKEELRDERYYELRSLLKTDRTKYKERLKQFQSEAEYNLSRNKHTKR